MLRNTFTIAIDFSDGKFHLLVYTVEALYSMGAITSKMSHSSDCQNAIWIGKPSQHLNVDKVFNCIIHIPSLRDCLCGCDDCSSTHLFTFRPYVVMQCVNHLVWGFRVLKVTDVGPLCMAYWKYIPHIRSWNTFLHIEWYLKSRFARISNGTSCGDGAVYVRVWREGGGYSSLFLYRAWEGQNLPSPQICKLTQNDGRCRWETGPYSALIWRLYERLRLSANFYPYFYPCPYY